MSGDTRVFLALFAVLGLAVLLAGAALVLSVTAQPWDVVSCPSGELRTVERGCS